MSMIQDDDDWRRGRAEMDDDLDELVDDEYGEEDEDEVVPCPECGADVYDDSPHCPTCGAYITHSTSPWHGKPWWWVVLGLAGILAVLYVMSPP